MKYIVEVQVAGDDKWYGNALVFDTRDEAKKYGLDLFSRWLLTTDYRVVKKPKVSKISSYRKNGKRWLF